MNNTEMAVALDKHLAGQRVLRVGVNEPDGRLVIEFETVMVFLLDGCKFTVMEQEVN